MSAGDIQAGNASIRVVLDDGGLEQQMKAVSARMRAAAAGLSAATVPALAADVTGPAAQYEAALAAIESVHKSGMVSAEVYERQIAEIGAQYAANTTPAQRLGVQLAELDGAMRRGDVTAEQYDAQLKSLVAGFQENAGPADRFEGTIVALDHDLRRGVITQAEYSSGLAAAEREFREAATPAQRYQMQIRTLDAQLKQNLITQQQHTTAVRSAKLELYEAEVAARKTSSSVGELGSAIAAQVKTLVGMATLWSVVRSVWSEFGKIKDTALTAEKLGMANQRFVGLQLAAQAADVELELVTSAMERMSVAIGKASLSGEESAKWMSRLGLSVADLEGLAADEQFLRIAEAMKEHLSATERLSASQEIFGKSSTDMVRLLSLTREKLDEATAAAIENGQALDDLAIEKIKNANDAVDRMNNAVEGLKRSLAEVSAPWVEDVAEGAANFRENVANEYTPKPGSVLGDLFGVEAEPEFGNDQSYVRRRREREEANRQAEAERAAAQRTSAEKAAATEKEAQAARKRREEEAKAAEAERRRQKEAAAREAERAALEQRRRDREAEADARRAAEQRKRDEETRARREAWQLRVDEEQRRVSLSSAGTFSGWSLSAQFTNQQIPKEQLAVLKQINDGVRKIRIENKTADFYT